MPESANAAPSRKFPLGRRNWMLLGAGLVTLVAGYAVLAAGHASAAAVLLVLGYCVLVPLALAL
ncbi:MAG: hypothetical protein ACOY71_05720 [Gemmatimonadota bacterium]